MTQLPAEQEERLFNEFNAEWGIDNSVAKPYAGHNMIRFARLYASTLAKPKEGEMTAEEFMKQRGNNLSVYSYEEVCDWLTKYAAQFAPQWREIGEAKQHPNQLLFVAELYEGNWRYGTAVYVKGSILDFLNVHKNVSNPSHFMTPSPPKPRK